MALNIFEPLKFSTQGINDLATQTSLVVSNGKITVDTVEPTRAVNFSGGSFADLDGKGIRWTGGNKNKTLALKQSKLWTDLSVNLSEEQEYQINDTAVLSFGELGPTVVKSNLKTLGTLRNLRVAGSAEIGEFTYINSELNRVGINTESPNAALGIRENGVELVFGSLKNNIGVIGTTNNDGLEIITDNTARISIANNGDVKIFGKLVVDEIITQRSSPLSFNETSSSSNYGKGIVWTSPAKASQFVMQAGPDRIWSTEIIDLVDNKYFSINKVSVLSSTSLGDTVTESNLQKLGILRDLQVAGDAAVTRTLHTNRIEIGSFALDNHRLETTDDFTIVLNDTTEFTLGNNITVGNSNNQQRTVSVYGQMTVGVANPEPGIGLTVAGAVSFENKKFIVGSGVPNNGRFDKGDIIWNNDPKATDYIGWVCVVPGEPGHWLPFGAIAAH